MSFQVPPTLPDFSKLITSLNASNVQTWNPELHLILKQLIQASGQSQQVITGQAGGTPFASDGLTGPPGPQGPAGLQGPQGFDGGENESNDVIPFIGTSLM